jgi:hypothetical protein
MKTRLLYLTHIANRSKQVNPRLSGELFGYCGASCRKNKNKNARSSNQRIYERFTPSGFPLIESYHKRKPLDKSINELFERGLLMNNLTTKQITLDSRDVAKMVEKEHKNLLSDIRGYVDNMEAGGELKIQPTDFFIESSYVTGQNKTVPCFLITRKGCEFIAN